MARARTMGLAYPREAMRPRALVSLKYAHPLLLALASAALTACPAAGDGGEKKADPKSDGKDAAKDAKDAKDAKAAKEDATKAREPVDETATPPKDDALAGPVPPEVSAVFFSVDGAMIPLACWDKDKGKLVGGRDCTALVKEGDAVWLGSESGSAPDTVGAPKNALCEVEDPPKSLGTPALEGGQTYQWAAFPRSLARGVVQLGADTRSDKATKLSDDETAKLTALATAAKSKVGTNPLRATQRAEVDLDGNGTNDVVYSLVVNDPRRSEQLLFSALVVATDGDLAKLVVIEENEKSDILTLRGTLDLDGDARKELWVSVTWDGGSGDKVMTFDGAKAKGLAGWTCGG